MPKFAGTRSVAKRMALDDKARKWLQFLRDNGLLYGQYQGGNIIGQDIQGTFRGQPWIQPNGPAFTDDPETLRKRGR